MRKMCGNYVYSKWCSSKVYSCTSSAIDPGDVRLYPCNKFSFKILCCLISAESSCRVSIVFVYYVLSFSWREHWRDSHLTGITHIMVTLMLPVVQPCLSLKMNWNTTDSTAFPFRLNDRFMFLPEGLLCRAQSMRGMHHFQLPYWLKISHIGKYWQGVFPF